MCGKNSRNSLRKLAVGLLLLLVLSAPSFSIEISDEDWTQIAQNLNSLELKLTNLQANYDILQSSNQSLQQQVSNWKTLYENSQQSLTALNQSLEQMQTSSQNLSDNLQKQEELLTTLEGSWKNTQGQLLIAKIGNWCLGISLGVVSGLLLYCLLARK